jgi:ribosomal protein S18 acetylase RimI-like enzyme
MDAKITLRDAAEEDYDFLYGLHLQALRAYIEQIWGWDEDWQETHFREHFNLVGKRIIQHKGIDVGCLVVHDEGKHLFLAYIALMPSYQDKGIGSQLIGRTLETASRLNKLVTLKVLKTNPARVLYERLGFIVTDETNTHYLMVADARDDLG